MKTTIEVQIEVVEWVRMETGFQNQVREINHSCRFCKLTSLIEIADKINLSQALRLLICIKPRKEYNNSTQLRASTQIKMITISTILIGS